jgi:hypothetical protein
MGCYEARIAADQASQSLPPTHDSTACCQQQQLQHLQFLLLASTPSHLGIFRLFLQAGPRHKQQLPASAPQPSFQETAAYLEGLFAASYEAQPLVDVDHCYQVRPEKLQDRSLCACSVVAGVMAKCTRSSFCVALVGSAPVASLSITRSGVHPYASGLFLQVLHGCPWVLPRPVFVLACKGPGASAEDDIRNTYTLRTKVKQEGAADALAKVRRRLLQQMLLLAGYCA